MEASVEVPELEDPDLVERDKEFYGAVREYLVVFLLFSVLYLISWRLALYFKRKRDKEEYFSVEEDGPYRVSLILCTFTLAVALAAICLLPFSILSCEVFLRYPDNYYMQWLNSSLLKLVWNWVFFFSNFCLLCMMPFVYFFMEAEGFSGWRSGLHSRLLETFVMLVLLLTLVSCSVWVVSKWFSLADGNDGSYLNIFPLLYSFLSLFGVLCTLLGLPVGIERIIMWLGNQLVLPKADDHLDVLQMEEDDLQRRLQHSATPAMSENYSSSSSELTWRRNAAQNGPVVSRYTDGTSGTTISGHSFLRPVPEKNAWRDNGASPFLPTTSQDDLEKMLSKNRRKQLKIKQRFGSSSFYRTMFFSLCTLFVLFLTVIALFSVGQSFLRLLFSPDALAMGASEVFLGHLKSSQTVLGSLGALLEMAIALFFAFSSLIGVYGWAYYSSLRPRPGDTPMVLMIFNCNLVLLLSSALPVLIRSLGISRFDLVGMFANLHWLSNWYLVTVYHLFFFATIVYLWTRRVTRSVVAKVGHFFNLVAHKKGYYQPYSPTGSISRISLSSPQSSLSPMSPMSEVSATSSRKDKTFVSPFRPIPLDMTCLSTKESPDPDLESQEASNDFAPPESALSYSVQSLDGFALRSLQQQQQQQQQYDSPETPVSGGFDRDTWWKDTHVNRQCANTSHSVRHPIVIPQEVN